VMRDTSMWSYTPSNFTMTQMVSLSVLVFMLGMAFMFWLGSLASKKHDVGAGDGAGDNVSRTDGEIAG